MVVYDLSKMNRTSRNAASASFAVVVALAMYNWSVAPHATYLSAAQQYDGAVENVIKHKQDLAAKVDGKKKTLEQLRQRYAELASMLFTFDQAREFFGDLQAISEETGCAVRSLNFISGPASPGGGQQPTAGVVVKSAVLTVEGVYGNMTILMQKLRSRKQKVWIDSVRMRALGRSLDLVRCDITITICTLEHEEASL
ncbi:MAG: hypothetical protein PVJ86_00570 [Phycisphaerales bacterium]|jgi:hypothetical protein